MIIYLVPNLERREQMRTVVSRPNTGQMDLDNHIILILAYMVSKGMFASFSRLELNNFHERASKDGSLPLGKWDGKLPDAAEAYLLELVRLDYLSNHEGQYSPTERFVEQFTVEVPD